MLELYRSIEALGPKNSSVLVTGESGTGKELIAKALHNSGPRRNKPFVTIDCSAIPSTLIGAELFGYLRGAFTGAFCDKQGLFEVANGGTVFLDETGELPLEMQARLLRVIQERQVKPIGATMSRTLDIRIVAATNRNLEQAVRSGRFRQDLFYRINVIPLNAPTLRERKTDIPLLAEFILKGHRESSGVRYRLTEASMRVLVFHSWPGNVRELENVIARAVAYGDGENIEIDNLEYQSRRREECEAEAECFLIEELERRAIMRALEVANGDKLLACRLLGLAKTTLYRKLKQYRIGLCVSPTNTPESEDAS